jgi:hypothetical protein
VTEIISFSATAATADTATHEAVVDQVSLFPAVPGATLECSLPVGDVLLEAISSAFRFSNAVRAPASDVGTWVFPSGLTPVNVRVATITSSVVTLSGFHPSQRVTW